MGFVTLRTECVTRWSQCCHILPGVTNTDQYLKRQISDGQAQPTINTNHQMQLQNCPNLVSFNLNLNLVSFNLNLNLVSFNLNLILAFRDKNTDREKSAPFKLELNCMGRKFAMRT